MDIKKIHLSGAKCAVDIGDGSERAEYVNQDYVINVLGRPHRMVNIMYTYYPNDKEWPQRVSEALKDMEVHFAWDYPYDDYFPFNDEGKQFREMEDIRKHGQDVMLTLTIDCAVDDSHLYKIAESLKPYGRMALRINHECSGDWFTHNKRFSYEEVADFFVRFSKIIKEVAPNIKTVFCGGMMLDADEEGNRKIEREDELIKGYQNADIWSADRYLALNYGWPYDIAEVGGGRYYADKVETVYNRYKDTYSRLCKLAEPKPLIQAEFNTDGDVTGPIHQGESIKRYYNMVKEDDCGCISGISMYQFRDRGRLGLEIEDPNNKSVGIKQPLFDTYKEIIFDEYFYPEITAKTDEQVAFPVTMRWGGSEDADGIAVELEFEKNPEFCEVTFDEDIALMMEINFKWFYKAKGVKTIDLMPAFFEKPLDGKTKLSLNIFATPADGINIDDGRDDWATNSYSVMKNEPEFRIRFEYPLSVD